MVGCCLALTTDCRLYSSHFCQCCLGPVPAGWDACCCRCSVELTGGSTHQLIFQINLLLGHVTLGCAIAFAGGDMDAVHNWSQYTHWTWHCTSSSDLLEYHTTHRYCTSLDVHAMGHVVLLTRAVSLDPLKQAWCSTSSDLIECYAMPVSAVCHWMCSLLDAMLSKAMLGGLHAVALTGRIRTCLICAVHHRTCWKDMRCCTTKVQSPLPTLSPCICSGAVAAFHRTGMWLACLSFSSQCSFSCQFRAEETSCLCNYIKLIRSMLLFPRVGSVESHAKRDTVEK